MPAGISPFAALGGRILTLSLSAVIVSACHTLPPPAEENPVWRIMAQRLQALDDWQLRGRVNVRYRDESHTPRLQWQQEDARYRIRLWGTFNAGNTVIEGRPGLVTMEQDGAVITAVTPESLILEQLGYELPVSYLEFWIRGLPAPASRADLRFDEGNQLVELEQDGWTVSYPDPRQYADLTLPRRVEVLGPRDNISLRFVGLSWTLPGQSE